MLEVLKPFFQRRADRGRKKIVQITERHAPGIARRHFADLKGGAVRQKVTDLLGRGAIGRTAHHEGPMLQLFLKVHAVKGTAAIVGRRHLDEQGAVVAGCR